MVAGQALGLYGVKPRKQRAANVGDALVVQRPAHLLDVMRDLNLPQHRHDRVGVVAWCVGAAAVRMPALLLSIGSRMLLC